MVPLQPHVHGTTTRHGLPLLCLACPVPPPPPNHTHTPPCHPPTNTARLNPSASSPQGPQAPNPTHHPTHHAACCTLPVVRGDGRGALHKNVQGLWAAGGGAQRHSNRPHLLQGGWVGGGAGAVRRARGLWRGRFRWGQFGLCLCLHCVVLPVHTPYPPIYLRTYCVHLAPPPFGRPFVRPRPPQSKPKGGRKLSFEGFVGALALCAAKRGVFLEDMVREILAASGPIAHATKADHVRLHDDKVCCPSGHEGDYQNMSHCRRGGGGPRMCGFAWQQAGVAMCWERMGGVVWAVCRVGCGRCLEWVGEAEGLGWRVRRCTWDGDHTPHDLHARMQMPTCGRCWSRCSYPPPELLNCPRPPPFLPFAPLLPPVWPPGPCLNACCAVYLHG